MNLTASAPGKLILSGEYAVLFGAPAVAVAVNRRAHVTVTRSGAGHHTVSAPGFTSATGQFVTRNGGIEWLDGGDEFRLLEQVWAAVGAQTSGDWSLELDSRAFTDAATGSKLGIGSSAALAAALATALAEAGGVRNAPSRAALEAHRQFQGGLGSGVDVACSLLGGLVEYSMGEEAARHLDWPEGLQMAVFWMGVPVSTGERLGQLEQQSARPSRQALVLESRRMAKCWAAGSAQAILAAYRGYIAALREFSADYGLGIFDAGHSELAELAEAAGMVYKPCGAGGGDCGVCLATDAAALGAFTNDARARNAFRPDIGIDLDGVRAGSAAA